MASTVPSLIGLVAKLKKLVHWKEFAIFLPDIDETDIEKVDLENPRNIDLQKQALFSKWLHKCAHPSWEDVISALESTDENMIAQSVSDAFHIVKPATNNNDIMGRSGDAKITTSTLEAAGNQKSLNCPDDIVEDATSLNGTYRGIVLDILQVLEEMVLTKQINLISLARRINELCRIEQYPLTGNETVNDVCSPITQNTNCFNPNLDLLLDIDSAFCKKKFQDGIKSFRISLRKFLASANIETFTESVQTIFLGAQYENWKAPDHSSEICVVIKVSRIYSTMAVENINKLIKFIFGTEHSSIMAIRDIHHSVLTITYSMPAQFFLPVLSTVTEKIKLLRIIGVVSIKIGDVLLPIGDEITEYDDINLRICHLKLRHQSTSDSLKPHIPHFTDCTSKLDEFKSKNICEDERSLPESQDSEKDNFVINNPKEMTLQDQPAEGMLAIKPDWDKATLDKTSTSGVYEGSLLSEVQDDLTLKEILLTSERVRRKLLKENEDLDKHLQSEIQMKKKLAIEVDKMTRSTKDVFTLKGALEERDREIERMRTEIQRLQQGTDPQRSSMVLLEREKTIASMRDELQSARRELREATLKPILLSDGKQFKLDDMFLLAIEKEDIATLRNLIQSGANIDYKGNTKDTPLQRVSSNGNSEIVQILLSNGALIEAKNESNNTSLHEACLKGYAQVVKILLSNGASIEAKNKNGNTPLHKASSSGLTEVVQILLSNGAEIEAKNNYGNTSLHKASSRGHVEVVQILLAYRAVMEAKNIVRIKQFTMDGYTPLHRASAGGHVEVVQILLSNRASIEAKSRGGHTPLHQASFKGRAEVVQILLSNKASIEAKDDSGYTPLHHAASEGFAEVIQIFLSNGAAIEAKDDDYYTPLHKASSRGYFEVVKILVSNGASTEATNENQDTALHEAASEGYAKVAQILLSNGASLEAKDKWLQSPLHVAIGERHNDVAMLLISAKANVYAENKYGQSPVLMATVLRNEEVIKCLLSNGVEKETIDKIQSIESINTMTHITSDQSALCSDPYKCNWVLPAQYTTEDDLRKKFNEMEIQVQLMWKRTFVLEQTFQDFKKISKPLTRINDMEKHLEGMNEAMKLFEKSKNDFGEQLISNMKDLRLDVDQLKNQRKEDTDVVTNVSRRQMIQEEQIKQLKEQFTNLFNLHVSSTESTDKRFKALENKDVTPKRKCKLRKSLSLPLSYSRQFINQTRVAPFNQPSTDAVPMRRSASGRNANNKLTPSSDQLPTATNTPMRRRTSSFSRRRSLNIDSFHSRKVLSTSTPDNAPIRNSDSARREESGYYEGYYGSPPLSAQDTSPDDSANGGGIINYFKNFKGHK